MLSVEMEPLSECLCIWHKHYLLAGLVLAPSYVYVCVSVYCVLSTPSSVCMCVCVYMYVCVYVYYSLCIRHTMT